MKRICKKCNNKLPLQAFYPKLDRKGKQRWFTRTCIKCLLVVKKEYSKKHYILNKDTYKKRQRIYQQTNRFRTYQNKWMKEQRKTNIQYRLRCSLSIRIIQALRGKNKSQNTLKLIGCNLEFFKNYLEKQFTHGMSWSNYEKKGWTIDHIIPCSNFDLSNPIEQTKCFHYTNLQPLWFTTKIGQKYGDNNCIGNCNKGNRVN